MVGLSQRPAAATVTAVPAPASTPISDCGGQAAPGTGTPGPGWVGVGKAIGGTSKVGHR
jgi:hypothetical protein